MRRRAVHHSRERNILMAFWLNSAFALIEGLGGLVTNSVAILSNAVHDLGDSLSLFGAYVSERSSHRAPDEKRTYGYRRLAMISAFANATALFSASLLIVTKAIPRLFTPEAVNSAGMVGLSIFGIVFNTLGVVRLRRGNSLSERVLRWHLLEDVFGWGAIAVVGTVLLFWDLPILDPVLTLLFVGVILTNVWRNAREIVNVLLEGVPPTHTIHEVSELLEAHPGVASVHDVHVWSLDGEQDLVSAHLVPRPGARVARLVRTLKEQLRRRSIEHAVFEVEADGVCAGGMERRIASSAQPKLLPSLLFAVGSALKPHGRRRRAPGRRT